VSKLDFITECFFSFVHITLERISNVEDNNGFRKPASKSNHKSPSAWVVEDSLENTVTEIVTQHNTKQNNATQPHSSSGATLLSTEDDSS
jgi:hypothetical protein